MASEVDVALLNLDLQNGNPAARILSACSEIASGTGPAASAGDCYGWDTRRKKAN